MLATDNSRYTKEENSHTPQQNRSLSTSLLSPCQTSITGTFVDVFHTNYSCLFTWVTVTIKTLKGTYFAVECVFLLVSFCRQARDNIWHGVLRGKSRPLPFSKTATFLFDLLFRSSLVQPPVTPCVLNLILSILHISPFEPVRDFPLAIIMCKAAFLAHFLLPSYPVYLTWQPCPLKYHCRSYVKTR